jgi:nucleotide-binding universal stress UspA family protein
MYKKIALAIAFSPTIEALLCEVKRLKKIHQAILIFIHIGEESEENKMLLNSLMERNQIDKKEIKIVWKKGKPAKKILQICYNEGVDLLVAGAQKKEGLFTYYMGSLARKIIRKANCSVLIFIEPSTTPRPFKKVVINGIQQPQTPFVIKRAIEFCKLEMSNRIFILNEIKMYGLQMATAGVGSEEEISKFREKLVNDEIAYVKNILEDLETGNLPINIKIGTGRWTTELAKFSENIQADLLVVGGQDNLSFFDRLFPHDLEDLLINLPCNVLILKN